jgi:hypothetical protein
VTAKIIDDHRNRSKEQQTAKDALLLHQRVYQILDININRTGLSFALGLTPLRHCSAHNTSVPQGKAPTRPRVGDASAFSTRPRGAQQLDLPTQTPAQY